MDKSKVDSKQVSASGKSSGISSEEEIYIIIVSSLIIFAALAIFVSLFAGYQMIASHDIDKIVGSIFPSSTPLPTLTPQPTATPLPNPQLHPGAILYSTTFNVAGLWYEGHTENEYLSEDRKVENGRYVWSATGKDGFIWYTLPSTDIYIFVDTYQISMDARMVNGPSDGAYGFVFNLIDNDNYWVWIIYPDGSSSVEQLVGGNWNDPVVQMNLSIQSGEMNTFTMKLSPHRFFFYVNGALVGAYGTLRPDLVNFTGSKKFGICIELYHVGDKATFEFDNIVVSNPTTTGK